MNNLQGIKNGMNLSQKFLDKIKPEYALKNKINGAEKQMESKCCGKYVIKEISLVNK